MAERAFTEALAKALDPAALAAEFERVHPARWDSEDRGKKKGRFAIEPD